MTTNLPANIDPAIDPAIVESVLLTGDLRKLNPVQKLAYYKSVCDSLGLNPITQPFAYIVLNNKEVLYAKREATEQLRNVHQISIDIKAREIIEGCYIVTATAIMPNGRRDESTGSVAIEGLKGDARANALMKAETKAKRRVTLSICGLGLLDESEIETIPNAKISAAPITIERPAPLPVPQTATATTASSSTLSFTVEPDPVPPPPEPEDYDPFEEPYITNQQAGMLARRFRESLREELQPMAEELRHNALAYFKYIDKDGNPSAKMIKAKDFVEVGKKLVAYARGLN